MREAARHRIGRQSQRRRVDSRSRAPGRTARELTLLTIIAKNSSRGLTKVNRQGIATKVRKGKGYLGNLRVKMLGLAMKVIPIIAAVSAFCPSPSLPGSFVVANTAGRRQRSNRPSRLSSLYGHVFGRGQIPEIDDVYQLSGGSGSDECLRRVSDAVRGGDYSRELEKLSRLSVTELKSLLDQNDIDYRDCLEKRDLVDRLVENKDRTGYYGEKNDSGLSHEENRVVNTFKRASPSVAFISVGQVQTVQRGFSTSQQDVPTGSGSGFLVCGQMCVPSCRVFV